VGTRGPVGGSDSAPSGAASAVHLAADQGVQAYKQPYPQVATDGSHRAAFIPGRAVLRVATIQGSWAQVFLNDEVVGWVEGSQLIPPIGPRVAPPSPYQYPSPASPSPPTSDLGVSVDTLVAALAGLGILIGSAVDWTQGIAANSFKIPAAVLFDANTTSRNPRLGFFVLGLGIAGLLLAFVRNARLWRGIVGAAAGGVAFLYCAQVASQLSDHHVHASFTDIVGAGPWVTGGAGLVLVVSAVLAPGP
jgi:hypothetical protein